MHRSYRRVVAAVMMAAALDGCTRTPPPGVLSVGKTYTAAVSMAMLHFRVVARKGHGWYAVDLLGHNLEPFTGTKPALINARQMSVLQSDSQ
ncbi:hypothetical protein [Acidiferrobacter sp.]|uniref:hypothetical protein n=1 Tax=Acidiferrobacter sp. TaxID=1872107 RepID=UPI0026226635|nr:hypothetical protein [Acidiferrobacter sp.]